MKKKYTQTRHYLILICLMSFFGTFNSLGQTSFFDDAVSSGTIWHSSGAEVANPLNNSDNSSATVIQNTGGASWQETQIFPDTYTIQEGDKFYISFYNPNSASSWQLKMTLSTTGDNAYIGDYSHDAGSLSTWAEIVIDLTAYAGEDLSKITIYPSGGEAISVNYDNIFIQTPSESTGLELYSEAAILGLFHSNGNQVSNPLNNADNSSATVLGNNGAGSWEETQLFPNNYTIQAGDKFYISFYNPNTATSWQLKMSLSTAGENAYIGDYNHDAGSSNTWVESVVDLSSYEGEDLSKIIIYPTGGDAKAIYYDNLYIVAPAVSSSTELFRETEMAGLWHSDGGTTANPQADAINYSATALINNGTAGWRDTQWFPNYTIQSNDRFYISFYNPNDAAQWQLRMDLSTTGAFTQINDQDYDHDGAAISGWVEASVDLSAYEGEEITKIQFYSSAGEAKAIYFDNVYFGKESEQVNQWIGATSNDWTNTANWEGNFVPTNLSNVMIASSSNNPSIAGDIATKSLKLMSNVSITSGSLTVSGDIDGTDGSLIVSSEASLIAKGSISGDQHQIMRNTTFDQATGKYSAVGSPVEVASTSDLGNLVYRYDEATPYNSTGNERFVEVTTPENIIPGNAYFSAFTGSLSFTGTPNTGTINQTLVYDTEADGGAGNAGFNLVSNPYAASIDVDLLIAENDNIDGFIYLWQDENSGSVQGSNEDYVIYSSEFNESTRTTATSAIKEFDGYLRSAQGFFVKADVATPLNFTTEMMVTSNNTDAGFYREDDSDQNIVRLSLTDETQGYSDIIIGLRENATDGVDRLYDAYKISTSGFNLYSFIEDERFAIQGLNNQDSEISVDLGFNNTEESSLILTLEEGRFDSHFVYLLDTELDKIVNLTSDRSYTFQSAKTNSTKRFQLLLSTKAILGLEELDKQDLMVYTNELGLNIKTLKSFENAKIKVFSMDGSSILETYAIDISGNWNIPFAKKGIFILTIETQDGLVTRKFLN